MAEDGTSTDQLLPGALSDRTQSDEPVDCPGFMVSWSGKQAQMVLPSSCLNQGNYGAVRFSYLSEKGADTDFGPQDEMGFMGTSEWIPRG